MNILKAIKRRIELRKVNQALERAHSMRSFYENWEGSGPEEWTDLEGVNKRIADLEKRKRELEQQA